MIGTRLNKCICGTEHSWRCATAIMRDRFFNKLYSYRWGMWFFLLGRWRQAVQERDEYKHRLRAQARS